MAFEKLLENFDKFVKVYIYIYIIQVKVLINY
jgi:hypothetical protein